MTHANEYCQLRKCFLARPCSWQKSYSEGLEADSHDREYLIGASFRPDGITVVFKDGSRGRKCIWQRRIPWIEIP